MPMVGATVVELKGAPEQIKFEYAQIAAHTHTKNLSVSESDCSFFIGFDLTYDESCTPIDSRINCPEEITLEYRKPVENYQPPEIWATREGFPNDLPHLNPKRSDQPASICLWRNGGNKALYESRGVKGLLGILVLWLGDAQDGTLQHDGWEPTPRGSDIQIFCGLGDLQSSIHDEMDSHSKIMCVGSLIHLWPSVEHPVIGNVFFKDDSSLSSQAEYRVVSTNKKFEAESAIVLLIAPNTNEVAIHNPLQITTEEDFNNYLAHCDINYSAEALKKYVKSLLPKGRKPKHVHLNVLIAHKRPIRLIEDIPGLANGDAGKIELIALLATANAQKESIAFQSCSLACKGSRALLSKVSATSDIADQQVIIAGCGSVGSSIADMLCKQGIRELTLIDKDRFSPHNPARHSLGKQDIKSPKVYGLNNFLTRHYHTKSIIPIWDEIGSPNVDLNRIISGKLFVDCTANPRVADEVDSSSRVFPSTKCYISMAGRIGILLSKSSAETFFDLEVLSYLAATEFREISDWLSHNDAFGLTTLGIGCGSNTFELPYSTIVSHTSFFQTLINRKLRDMDSSGIFINTLDENFFPTGSIEVEVPVFEELRPIDGDQEWTIALSSAAQHVIEAETKANIPHEAAGYLLGCFNTRIKRIAIVAATLIVQQDPSQTNATLPPVNQDDMARHILKKTNGLIRPVGTWHSHPSGGAQPSQKDKNTFSSLIKPLKESPQPYVMLIFNSDAQKTTSLIIPEDWR